MEAKRNGTCAGCTAGIKAGDDILIRRQAPQVYHRRCNPGNERTWREQKNLKQARAVALSALEDAILAGAAVHGTDEKVEKQWSRYEKLKAAAFRPGSSNEERLAWKNALIDAARLAF